MYSHVWLEVKVVSSVKWYFFINKMLNSWLTMFGLDLYRNISNILTISFMVLWWFTKFAVQDS